jgi:hypothetical protein
VNDEIKRILKEATPGIRLEVLTKTTKTSVRIAGFKADI